MVHDRPFWADRTVCVTGGTGFLGFHLVRQLLDHGAIVRVCALPAPLDHPLRKWVGVELIEGDIRDPAVVCRALDHCDVVFHAAGNVGGWGADISRLWSVHVEGTKNVLQFAAPGARIVHTASIMAVGAAPNGERLDEQSPFNLGRMKIPYCHAKRAAEELALAAGRDVVVTNPGFLVGPEDHELSIMGRLCVRFWRGRVPVSPPGGVNLVDVRDAAAGHLLAAERGRSGQRYILGGVNRTFAAFMNALAEAADYSPRGLPRVPAWALTALAGLSETRAWLTGREPYPSMTHARLNRVYWFYRSDKAMNELGFQSRPLAETLAETHSCFCTRLKLEPRGLNRWWMRPKRAA